MTKNLYPTFCPNCGAEVDRGQRYCEVCGSLVDASQPTLVDASGIGNPFDAPEATLETPAAPANDANAYVEDRPATQTQATVTSSVTSATSTPPVNPGPAAAPMPSPAPYQVPPQPAPRGGGVGLGIGVGLAVSAVLVAVLFLTGVLPPKSGTTATQDAQTQLSQQQEGEGSPAGTGSATNELSTNNNTTQQQATPTATNDTTTVNNTTPVQTVTQEPEPTPAPTPARERYELVVADVSWTDADAACRAKGGHLATITSADEWNKLISMAESAGLSYVWLGGTTSSGYGQWVTGEPFSFTAWYEGEPSLHDLDGTPESYIEMWRLKSTGQWSWNDERNAPFEVSDMSYMRGQMGYICEYED